MNKRQNAGFTVVELLIVIVVVAILVALSLALYGNIQARARITKAETDLATLEKAIQAARTASGEVALRYVTLSTSTAWDCVALPSEANLADKSASAACWDAYSSALDKISSASGHNVRGLADSDGRPYVIDENEQDGGGTCGMGRDTIGVFPASRAQYDWSTPVTRQVPYITAGC